MKKSFSFLRMPLLLSVVSICVTGLWIGTFFWGVNTIMNPQSQNNIEATQQEEKRPVENFVLVSLGDSLTRGVGDESGNGYVGRVKQQIEKESNQSIVSLNLGVSGAKTTGLIKLLNKKATQSELKRSDAIIVSISGNDLLPNLNEDTMNLISDEQVKRIEQNCKIILDEIRKVNKVAPVYWIGLYNPFESIEAFPSLQKPLLDWNARMEVLTSSFNEAYFIPTYDIYRGSGNKLLYTDQFHPNEQGYIVIGDRVFGKMSQHFKWK